MCVTPSSQQSTEVGLFNRSTESKISCSLRQLNGRVRFVPSQQQGLKALHQNTGPDVVKMQAQVNKLHFLIQLQKKLQPDCKTNNIQYCQKIELNGTLTTKDLKKPHSSRWVEGAETQGGKIGMETWCDKDRQQNGWSHIHMWQIKIGRDTSGVGDPSPKPDHPAVQGSSARKIKSHTFCL